MKTIPLNHKQAVLLRRKLNKSRNGWPKLPKRLHLAETDHDEFALIKGDIPMVFPFSIWDDARMSFLEKDGIANVEAESKFLSSIGIIRTSEQTSLSR